MIFKVNTTEIQKGGSLEDFYYNLLIGRDDLQKTSLNGVTTVSGELELSIADVSDILNAGGEVEEYLMALRADKEVLTDDVPNTMPKYQTFSNGAKTVENWFDSSCELWANAATIADATQVYFLTNPLGTTRTEYLKGSEISDLANNFGYATPVVDRNMVVKTILQFETEVETGWTRIN